MKIPPLTPDPARDSAAQYHCHEQIVYCQQVAVVILLPGKNEKSPSMMIYRWNRKGEELTTVRGQDQRAEPGSDGYSIDTEIPYLRCCMMGRITRYGDPE